MIEKDNVFQVCKLRINIAFLNERYCKIKSSVTKMIWRKYRWWVATDHERRDNFPKKKRNKKLTVRFDLPLYRAKYGKTRAYWKRCIFQAKVEATIINQRITLVPLPSVFERVNQAFGSVAVHKQFSTRFHFYVTVF